MKSKFYFCSIKGSEIHSKEMYLGRHFLHQKRVIKIMTIVVYGASTDQFFIDSNVLKFIDIVYLKTMENQFYVVNKSLPPSMQTFVKLRDGQHK